MKPYCFRIGLLPEQNTLATCYTLSKAIEKLGRELPVDLVLCGKQAIDGTRLRRVRVSLPDWACSIHL
jgi:hypothetical protein